MSEEGSGEEPGTRRQRTIFVIVSIYLICMFLWRFFVPSHEYPRPTTRFLTIALDAGMLIALIGLRVRTSGSYYADSTRAMAAALFWVALIAGIGLFAIRLGGDAQWATGHRIYYLPPR